MQLSRETKIVSAILLLMVPTVQFGGMAILGMISHGIFGWSGERANLDVTQLALFRAGHAHAGVWLVLSLIIQILLDSARLSALVKWAARIAAPLGTLALSGGFFGLAFRSGFKYALYFGAAAMFLALLTTAAGLFRNLNSAAERRLATLH
jgi:hypothetical protein